ncbi:Cupin superfamily protein [Mactra antiquata]
MYKRGWPVTGVVLLFLTDLYGYEDSYVYTGGWDVDKESMIAQPGPCNIDIIDVQTHRFSQEDFIENYAYKKPVIIRRATNNKKLQDMCTKDKLLQRYGDHVVRLSSANTHSYRKRDVTLNHYVEEIMKPQTLDMLGNETFYWFGDNDYDKFSELFDTYIPPPFDLPSMTGVYSFGLAASGTGVPFHFHGPGFAEVIIGRKRWFLYPPDKQPNFNPDKTTLHWLKEEYNNLSLEEKPLECTMSEGEAIYFPDRWWHGTLNIDTSVFISTFLG